MSRPKNPIPKYCHHRPSGRAYVRVPDANGCRRTVYLGPHGSQDSKEAYRAELAKLDRKQAATPMPVVSEHPSVNEVLEAFHAHAEQYYRRLDGTHTQELCEFRIVIRHVRLAHGEERAEEFGPRKLRALREAFIRAGWSRKVINQRVNRLRHLFKWAVSHELIPPSVFEGMRTVEGLKAGRTAAPERPPVAPVDDAAVLATLPWLRPTVCAMVELQRLTGMRPGEVVRIRPCDIDTGAAVWVYRPPYHKLSYRNLPRAIAIGPKAQAILKAFMPADASDYIFSPQRSVEEYHAERSAARVTPLWPSHARRNAEKRIEKKSRRPNERYGTDTYRRAITKAVEQLNRAYIEAAVEVELQVEDWAPNRLRHAHATDVRKRFGLEAAQVALGHERADVTQVYAEKNLALAVKVAAEVG